MTAPALAAALLAVLHVPSGQEPAAPPGATVERRLGAMGTWLELHVEAGERASALACSEAAARAVEAVEERLSTWRAQSELSRLNAAPVGEPLALSAELAADLAAARRWWEATGGAFDPSVGALVDAWDLRGAGRVPDASERAAARVEGGFGALELRGLSATRTRVNLRVEEGGFGKGVGLDAALAALQACGARRAWVDLGGQIAVLGAASEPVAWSIADPRDRERPVLAVELPSGSLATSGNAERAIVVDGVRHGHLLDPRTGAPAADFGSLSVWASDATAADCLATGLYVLGPDAALAWAAEREGVEVLVLEPLPEGLRGRATPGLARRLAPLVADISVASTEPDTDGPREAR